MIPIFKPSFGEDEVQAFREVLLSGWVGTGPKAEKFEQEFADYIGIKYAISVNSCTSALMLALKVSGVENKEVITTPMTFVATNHAVIHSGAEPVFTDISPDTYNIDPAVIKKNITSDTRAIVAVHYGGHPCDMDEINGIAKENNLIVIEDCAHACGAVYKGEKAGSIGHLGCFSFHVSKNISTGDGGMIVTNDKDMYLRLKKIRSCGVNRNTWERSAGGKYSWLYNVDEVGYKCYLNDTAAAIGSVQLKKIKSFSEKRDRLTAVYDEQLAGVDWLTIPCRRDYVESSKHNYVISTDKRDDLNVFLAERDISTGVHYYPNNLYEIYKNYGKDTPVAHRVWKNLLTLPLYPDLTDSEIYYIIEQIKDFGGES
jgi:perosamine synthetase